MFLGADPARTATPLNRGVEKNGRQEYLVKDWFATFQTLGDCFTYHARLLLRESALPWLASWHLHQGPGIPADVGAFIDAIAPHYATDPNYAAKVKELAFSPEVQNAIGTARKVIGGTHGQV